MMATHKILVRPNGWVLLQMLDDRDPGLPISRPTWVASVIVCMVSKHEDSWRDAVREALGVPNSGEISIIHVFGGPYNGYKAFVVGHAAEDVIRALDEARS